MNKITLTLEDKEYQIDIQKAKELGVIKEKDTRCKSWGEFLEKYSYKSGYLKLKRIPCPIYTEHQLTQEEAVAISAFSKLLKLRRDWIGEWNPDWCESECKYCIILIKDFYTIQYFYSDHHVFSFPTEEMAKEFLKCFENLFKICKHLV